MTKSNVQSGSLRSEPGLSSDPGLSLVDVFRMLTAHGLFILVCILVGLTASIVYVRRQIPLYEAVATIRIDPGRASSLGLSDMVPSPSGDPADAIHTEIAIIKSDAVAVRTLNSIQPDQFMEFAGYHKAPQAIPENGKTLSKREEALVDRIKLQTVVKLEDGTQLLDIKFRDHDPQLAATIANELVHNYVLQSFSSRSESVAQLHEWLSSQMDNLRKQVDESQEKLAKFQREKDIITTTDAHNTISDRLTQLNEKWTEAQANRIVKEAQMRAAEGVKDPATLASVTSNAKLQALQTEQVDLTAQYEQLASKFGENYPPLVEKQKQIAKVNTSIESTVASMQKQLSQEYEAADKSEKMFRDQYNKQAGLAYALNSNQATYAQLQSDVTSARELYETLQRKSQQATVDTEVNSVETVVVDSARAPNLPVEPKKSLIVVGGALVGLFAGIVSAFFFEATSDRVQSPERIERALGYSALTTIPVESKRPGSSTLAEQDPAPLVMIQHPLSQDAESYRTLRNAALLSEPDGSGRAFLFAGALPGDEVSTVAANFAVSLAQTGAKVLIADCDLRHPGLHPQFAIENGPGLAEFLDGKAVSPLEKTPVSRLPNLRVITAGLASQMPSESLASKTLRSLLEKWEESFDYIVLTAAPLLVVSDSLPVASYVDYTILVARYNVTKLANLSDASRLLSQSNARIAGFVLCGVPKSVGLGTARKAYWKEYYA